MKKWICLFIALLMVLSLVACGKEKEELPKPYFNPAPDDDTGENNTSEPLIRKMMQVHSLDELETLRQMLNGSTEKVDFSAFGQFCERSDYEKFVKLYDTLPKLPLMEGEVSCIVQYGDDVMMIATENENGEWFRAEYQLNLTDVSELKIGEESTRFETAIGSKDNRLTVHSEKRMIREDGMEVITWSAELDDMPMFVFYGSNEKGITAEEIFTELTVTDPAK